MNLGPLDTNPNMVDGSNPPIHPSWQTPLACSDCGCGPELVKMFYLKRRRGLYALLCFREGAGCWERSSKTLCRFVDEHQAQCTHLADREIIYGRDSSARTQACTEHVGKMLSDHALITVCPLED
jgi:hypothetical protein